MVCGLRCAVTDRDVSLDVKAVYPGKLITTVATAPQGRKFSFACATSRLGSGFPGRGRPRIRRQLAITHWWHVACKNLRCNSLCAERYSVKPWRWEKNRSASTVGACYRNRT